MFLASPGSQWRAGLALALTGMAEPGPDGLSLTMTLPCLGHDPGWASLADIMARPGLVLVDVWF